ncbi:hypothetical protein L218DRAFT_940226 [Marasmius fiardii PR-910]|nr:hypothetical protein L218DRAFT_940226 [Marasmius fiardii PR-910]
MLGSILGGSLILIILDKLSCWLYEGLAPPSIWCLDGSHYTTGQPPIRTLRGATAQKIRLNWRGRTFERSFERAAIVRNGIKREAGTKMPQVVKDGSRTGTLFPIHLYIDTGRLGLQYQGVSSSMGILVTTVPSCALNRKQDGILQRGASTASARPLLYFRLYSKSRDATAEGTNMMLAQTTSQRIKLARIDDGIVGFLMMAQKESRARIRRNRNDAEFYIPLALLERLTNIFFIRFRLPQREHVTKQETSRGYDLRVMKGAKPTVDLDPMSPQFAPVG